jgi:hypothetical protein
MTHTAKLDKKIAKQAEKAAATVENCNVDTCTTEMHWCTGCECHLEAAYTCSNCD